MADRATILHADLDAFYASVEQLLDPGLRNTPMAVGSGVVLAASYEAKAFGVSGGMSTRRAKELCPHLKMVGGHFSEYQRLGDAAIDIMKDFTPLVERISIDEAFLDVAGSIHLLGSPTDIAITIRRRVKDELGLPVSVGIARTKHLAKIASQVAKPDGLLLVPADRELEFLHPLPAELMWGVGPVTKARLAEMGIRTIGELAEAPGRSLERLLGAAIGTKLGALAWNSDPRAIEQHHSVSSVSAQSALGRSPVSDELIERTIRHLADRVASRLRAKSKAGHTVTARVRFADLRSVTRSVTLPAAVSVTPIIAEVAESLVRSALHDHPDVHEVSLLAVGVSGLAMESALQLELPLHLEGERIRPGTEAGSSRWVLDKAVDEVREKFGKRSIGYASVVLDESRAVPDEFRELAEH
jgi:DNA polymerase-4